MIIISAILFGIRKQLQAESGKEELKKRLEELESQKIELTNRVRLISNNLENTIGQSVKGFREKK